MRMADVIVIIIVLLLGRVTGWVTGLLCSEQYWGKSSFLDTGPLKRKSMHVTYSYLELPYSSSGNLFPRYLIW